MILDQKDHLEVIDRLETRDKEATVSWMMVTPAEAKITGKNRIELTKDGQRMSPDSRYRYGSRNENLVQRAPA